MSSSSVFRHSHIAKDFYRETWKTGNRSKEEILSWRESNEVIIDDKDCYMKPILDFKGGFSRSGFFLFFHWSTFFWIPFGLKILLQKFWRSKIQDKIGPRNGQNRPFLVHFGLFWSYSHGKNKITGGMFYFVFSTSGIFGEVFSTQKKSK